jgi:hypothetical protein
MKVGDLVVRTYGEGHWRANERPWALLVGWHNDIMAEVIWAGTDRVVQFRTKYLEVISESR